MRIEDSPEFKAKVERIRQEMLAGAELEYVAKKYLLSYDKFFGIGKGVGLAFGVAVMSLLALVFDRIFHQDPKIVHILPWIYLAIAVIAVFWGTIEYVDARSKFKLLKND